MISVRVACSTGVSYRSVVPTGDIQPGTFLVPGLHSSFGILAERAIVGLQRIHRMGTREWPDAS